MVYFARNPIGYKNLLTWQQSDRIYMRTIEICKTFHHIRDSRLIDQMVSSARSVKRNIEEGFKRATTAEYIQFLGYSAGSLAELRGDFEDCSRLRTLSPAVFLEMETLLRGEDIMLGRQIRSLERKMDVEGTRPQKERFQSASRRVVDHEKILYDILSVNGLVRLPDGRVVKKDDGSKGDNKGI
jgi:four helix bundle protein